MAEELQGSVPELVVEGSGFITILRLNRPKRRNALNASVLSALREALVAAGGSRAIVLTGSEGNFCAGADLSGVEDREFVELLRSVLIGIRETPCPVIAAIDGFALGAGTQLATACDLRVAASDSTFGIPAAKLGLTVDWWTVRRVAAICGESVARALLVGGEQIGGDRARELGYVHRLAEPSGALREARAWAEQLAELAPLTLAAHKTMLNRIEDDHAYSVEVEAARLRAWSSADLQEGLAAFRDRRPPRFTGR